MKKCLIVVDYQRDFVSGAMGSEDARRMEAKIAKKILTYRDAGDRVLYTVDRHGGSYLKTLEGRGYPIPHCLKKTQGERVYGMVGSLLRRRAKRFRKDTFGSDRLYEYLRNHRFLSIEFAGVTSHVCVLANLILARTAQPETPILVDPGCVSGTNARLHEAALALMPGFLVTVRESTDDN
jgi:nicotinamidase-related amidase